VSKDDATEGFVQEVDQRVREERLLADAKLYGPWLAGLFVVFLLGLGGWQLWQQQQANAAREQSAAFAVAQQLAQQSNLDGAKAAFLRLTTQGTPNYRVMARMEYAAIQQIQGDLDGAIASFDQAAAATNEPILKETAQLRAAYLVAETQDFEALQRRLQPMLQSHSRISYLGRELLAIQAWRTGHNDIARNTLQDITLAFDAPDGVRQRAEVTLSLLPPEAPAASATNSPARGASPAAPAQGAHP
jgi:hypothetical protein